MDLEQTMSYDSLMLALDEAATACNRKHCGTAIKALRSEAGKWTRDPDVYNALTYAMTTIDGYSWGEASSTQVESALNKVVKAAAPLTRSNPAKRKAARRTPSIMPAPVKSAISRIGSLMRKPAGTDADRVKLRAAIDKAHDLIWSHGGPKASWGADAQGAVDHASSVFKDVVARWEDARRAERHAETARLRDEARDSRRTPLYRNPAKKNPGNRFGHDRHFDGELFIQRIKLDRGGYAHGGQYFGVGAPVYEIESADYDIHFTVRAADRKGAAAAAWARYPNAKIKGVKRGR